MDIKIVFELLSIFPGTAEGKKKWGGTLKRNSHAVLLTQRHKPKKLCCSSETNKLLGNVIAEFIKSCNLHQIEYSGFKA